MKMLIRTHMDREGNRTKDASTARCRHLVSVLALILFMALAVSTVSAQCYDTDGDGAYNTSSAVGCAGYRDCDDYNATLLPPRDNLNITTSIVLCSGTCYLNDSGAEGVLALRSGSASVRCNQTVIIGNTSGTAASVLASSSIRDCDFRNYSRGASVNGSSYWDATYRWSAGDDHAEGVATDSSSNVIIAGYQTWDWKVLKLSKNGVELWNKTIDWSNKNYAWDVETDSSDNIVVVGSRQNTADDDDWAVVKLDSNGNELWNRTYPGLGNKTAWGVDTDSNNNIFIAGISGTSMWTQWLIMKLNSTGGGVWNRSFSWSASNDNAYDVAVDSSNNIYVVGQWYNTSSFTYEWRIVKMDNNGNELWNRSIPWGKSQAYAYGVDTDSSNGVVVGGDWRNGSYYDWGVLKLDSNGNMLWNKSYSWSGRDDMAYGVAVDSGDNAVVVGYWNNTNGSHYDWLLLKLDSSGNTLWNKSVTWSNSNESAEGVAVDGLDNIYAVGYWYNASSGIDWHVLKLSAAGTSTISLVLNGTYIRNTGTGLLLQSSASGSIFNNTITSSTGCGLSINDTDSYTIRNTTFSSNYRGVCIDSNSTANLFYYNSFISSTSYHASSAVSGNYFNTTNGSSCGANCSRGNYWDDILSLDIVDSNSDGFGDSGTQYPYNSTFSSKVTANVTDWGPMMGGMPCGTIDSPGTYQLTQDLVGSPTGAPPLFGTACMNINVSDVIFDCDGHTIRNNATGVTYGIVVNGPVTNVTVRNCPGVWNYTYGIYLSDADGGAILNSTAHNNTVNGFYLYLSSGNRIMGDTAYNNSQDGFQAYSSPSNNFTNNSAYLNGQRGFYLYISSDYCILEDNTAVDNAGYGFEAFSSSYSNFTGNVVNNTNTPGYPYAFDSGAFTSNNRYVDNYARNSAGFSAHGDGHVFMNNTAVETAGGYGFLLSSCTSGCQVINNTFNGFGSSHGVYLSGVSNAVVAGNNVSSANLCYLVGGASAGTTVEGNIAYNCSNSCFYVGSNSVNLTNNTADTCGNHGFYLTASYVNVVDVVVSNSTSNAGFYLFSATYSNLTNVRSYGNTDGFHLYAAGTTGNRFVNATTYGNSQYGFYITSGPAANEFVNISTHGNSGYGIYITTGSSMNATNVHSYNNSVGDLYVNPAWVGGTVYLRNLTIDNPLGTSENYTSLDIYDSLPADFSEYGIRWTPPSTAPPAGRFSFAQKFVNISTLLGTVSIDAMNWTWLDAELGGYDESRFALWKWNGTWSDTGAALDAGANTLSLANLDPASDYGILESLPFAAVNVTLNSTYGTNYSDENLTVYWDVQGASGPVKNITDWYLDGTSIAVLDLPFEANNASNMSSWTKDYSNFSNHGAVVGAAWNGTGGHDGFGAYYFNGSNYIDSGTGGSLAIGAYEDFTVESWVRYTDSGLRSVYGYADASTAGIWQTSLSGQLYCRVSLGTGSYVEAVTPATYNDGSWHHVVCTGDRNVNVSVYVDGVLRNTNSISAYEAGSFGNSRYIGGYPLGGINFTGNISELRLYNRSLTAGQILLLYQNRTDRMHSGETEVGDVWKACITPNDGAGDGAGNCSNDLTILMSCDDYDGDGAYGLSSDAGCPGYRDCDDSNANILPPRNDLNINRTMVLCNGTYYVNDSGGFGLLRFAADGVNLTCNGTIMVGNSSGYGVVDTYSNVTVKDCTLANYSSAAYVGGLWNRTLAWNSTGPDIAYGVGVDSSGNSFVAGYWRNGSQYDWGLAKYDSSGVQLWNRTLVWNSTADDYARGVAVDSSGNAFVAGYWDNGGQRDWGLAKYDSGGSQLWSRNLTWNSADTDVATGVGVDSSGNSFVAGYWRNGSQYDWGLAKYDSSGVQSWNRTLVWNSTADDQANGVAVDSSGNAFVAGYWNSGGQQDWGLAKYDSSGSQLWSRNLTWNSTGDDQAVGVGVDSSGNVFVAGFWRNGGQDDWGLVKYDSSGVQLWNRTLVWNSAGSDQAWGVGVDSSGNAFVVGYWDNGGQLDWGLAKYDPSGVQLWNRTLVWNSTGPDIASGVGVDSSGNAFVAGAWYDGGQYDWGLAKVSGAGNLSVIGSVFLNDSLVNSTRGVELSGFATGNTLRNSTLLSNTYGAYIGSEPVGNLFYYNNFTGNSVYHAYSLNAGNYFNTTNGSACGANCSRGNYWDDILTLDIIDSNLDGFGDSGTQYPYNSTFSGKVTANVTDWGPMTSKQYYTGCVDLDNESTYQGRLVNNSDGFWINQNITLCSKTYIYNDTGAEGVIRINASYLSLDCNSSTLLGNGSGAGIYSSSKVNVTVRRCYVSNYTDGMRLSTPSRFYVADNVAYDNSGRGFALLTGSNNTLVNNTGCNNTNTAFDIVSCSGCVIFNNSAYNTVYGFTFGFGSNNTISNNTAYDQQGYGYYVDRSHNNTLSNNTAYNAQRGFSLDKSNENRFFRNVARNCTDGMSFLLSNSSTVWNNTLQDNSYGVNLTTSVSNLFYYNNFINSADYHAFATLPGNFFNTTNGSGCGANCSRGNYWDDILSLDIIDSNVDGFGDAGADYPYNATNGGNVSDYVQDEGPITTKLFIDSTPPNGSIVIFGPNGTDITGTRNVLLNLTFADDIGVGMCRWANDNESNLAAAPWENCTTVKAWILSEAEGNKTVYYQVRDTSGNNVTLNDSIVYFFMQDYTAPSAPVVYDGLGDDDIDWWNDNTTLSAHWFNASEDISVIYYRYRILENGSCYNGDCNFTSTGEDTEVTVGNLSLLEGSLYSFEVEAYNPFNLSSSAVSDGARIDVTPPDAPNVSSPTHPDQDRAYPFTYAELNWSAADVLSNGNMSGIAGYSYLLDSYPGTAPDDMEEERDWETLAHMYNDGYNQTLKLNGSAPADYAYAVFSQLHTNMTANDSIRVRVALAELVSDYRDLMDVKVYLAKIGDGTPISSFSMESSAISDIVSVSRDIAYAANLALATVYEFDLVVNDTTDDVAEDIYVVVSGLSSDDDNRNVLAIAGTTSSIDSSTKNFVCDELSSCLQNTTDLDYAIEVKRADSGDGWETRYESLGDGTYYFHVKARDVAGNWGDTSHYRINVAAGGVSVSIASPVDGELFTSDEPSANISVRAVVSGNASVYVVAEHPDGSTYTSPGFVYSTTHTFENITLEQGINEIYAVANTSAGAVTTSSVTYVTLAPSIYQTTNKTLRIGYAGCAPSANPYICYSDEGGYVGVGTESSGAIAAGYAQADTSSNTIKIFMSKQFDLSKASDDLEENDFLDQRSPSFGYGGDIQHFVIGSELRYPDVYLDGDLRLQPGKYDLYIIHSGVTPDGKVNLTVEVR